MPYVPIDINKIKLDAPTAGGFAPVDINSIKLDNSSEDMGKSTQEPGIIERLGNDYNQRKNEMRGLADQAVAGDISKHEAALRGGLKLAQLIPDFGTEVLRSGFRSLPDSVEKPIRQGASDVYSYIANSPVGDVASNAFQKYQSFEERHPVAAGRVGSVLDAGNVLLPFAPIGKGKSVVNAVEDTVYPVARKTGELIDTAKGALSKPKITSDMIKAKASQAYKSAEQFGGELTPDFTNRFIDTVQEISPQTEAGRLVIGDSEATKLVDRLQALRDKPISLKAAQEIDETLGELIDKNSTLGVVNKEGKRFADLQSDFRSMIESAGEADIVGGKEGFEALKEGRRLWSAQAKLRDIEKLIQKASSTDNPAGSLKTAFRNFAANDKKMRGFTPQEKLAIRRAGETGVVTDLLRLAGSRLVPIGAGIATGGIDGLITAGVAAGASSAARKGATALQMRKANKIGDLIVKRSGVNKSNLSSLLGEK